MKFLYLKGIDIFGPFEAEQIKKEAFFSDDLLVCPEDKAEQEAAWKPASRYEDFKAAAGEATSSVEDKQPAIEESSNTPENTGLQDKNISQDLPALEDTETETSPSEEDFSFKQIMEEMSDKPKEDKPGDDDIVQDHTFHISNKEDNLLEDLPAHRLLGSGDSLPPNPDLNNGKDISTKQNNNIQETDNIQGNRDFLEISNNKIISSSDGRVKKQRPNDLLFILSFIVLMVVAVALCMAFWNMMNGNKNISETETVQNQNTVQPGAAEQYNYLIPEPVKQEEEQETDKKVAEIKPATIEEQVIDIVKNTKLKNESTIGDYLSKVYGQEYQSSWSAKPFTDNVYIVEFFASQVRNEPYVYLFRVDMDQKKITGALNNITLDLLA